MSPWSGYRKCLRDPWTPHLCVLQDDVRLCHNFMAACGKLVETRPDDVISLFVGGLPNKTRKDYLEALKAGRHFSPVYFRDIHHCVAVIWPQRKAEQFLEWTEKNKIPGPQPPRSDDAVFGAWARRTRQTVWATVPSLVEHPDDVPSTVHLRARSGADKGRVAISFIGERDPLEIDWDA